MIYVSNAFSLSMLDREQQRKDLARGRSNGFPRIPYPVEYPRKWIQDRYGTFGQVVSIIGHADVAAVISSALGLDLKQNRKSVVLTDHDVLLVAQYIGPRLEEGTTRLPGGARIEWWAV